MANILCCRGPLLRSLSGLQLDNQLRREATTTNILNRRLPCRTALNAAASPRSHRSSLKSHATCCEAAESFNASRSEAGTNPRLSVFGSPRPSILQNTAAHTPLHVARARRGFLSELQSIKDEENVAGPISYESPLDIVLYPDPRLRAPNKRVNVFDESLQKLVAEMFDVMYRTEGVGLSAPQVGVNVRLMVYNPVGERGKGVEMVLVNPRIVKYAKARDVIEEGCLSFPKIYADVERPMGVKVDAQDINGRKFSISLKEWQARIFQHEYDHLEGTLYFDRMTPEVLDTIRSKLIDLEDNLSPCPPILVPSVPSRFSPNSPPPHPHILPHPTSSLHPHPLTLSPLTLSPLTLSPLTLSRLTLSPLTLPCLSTPSSPLAFILNTDGTVPNTLVVSNAYVVKPRVAAPRDICRFKYDRRSPFVRKFKTIVHPGEVNRIRELVQNRNIIFTHTDSPDVLMWHVERHPFCTPSFNTPASTPDLILVGHTDDAEFAMATSPVAPLVISGGKDHNVLLWNVADHVTSLQSSAALRKPHPAAKPKAKAAAAPSAPSRSAPSASVSSRARADSPARSGGRGGGGGGGGDGDGGSAVGDAEKKRKREEVVVKGEEVKEVKEGEKEDGGGEGDKRGRGLEGSGKKEEKEVEGKEGGEGKQEEAKKENGEKEKKVEGEKKVVKEEEGKEKGEDGEEKEGEEKEKGGEGKEEGEGKEKEEGTTVEESKEKGTEGEEKVVEGEGKAEEGTKTKEEAEGKVGSEAKEEAEENVGTETNATDKEEEGAEAQPAGADADVVMADADGAAATAATAAADATAADASDADAGKDAVTAGGAADNDHASVPGVKAEEGTGSDEKTGNGEEGKAVQEGKEAETVKAAETGEKEETDTEKVEGDVGKEVAAGGGAEAGSKSEAGKKEGGGDDAEITASAAPAGADADAPSEAVKESEGMDVDKTGGEEGEGGRKSDAVGSDKAGGEDGEEAGGGSKEVKEEKAVEERKEGKSKEEDGTTDGAPTGMVVDEATGGGAGGTGAPGDDEAEADADAAGKPTAAARSSSPSPPLKLGYAPKSTSLAPRGVFKGHTATVEDVCFHPSHSQQFCSVGDDSRLLLWDARTGGEKGPCQRVEKAHDSDVHCVDWNGRNEHMVVTGGADKSVRLFDVRKLGGGPVGKVEGEARGKAKATHAFRGGHQAAVLSVQWCPDSPTVFASCAEDGLVNIWDCSLLHVEAVKSSRADGVPPGLLFQHVGHQDRVIEFQWAPKDPWTFASVSSNVNKRRGGGTLQMWRVLDLIYRPAKDVVIDLNRYELASRGFVDNLRPPMAAAAELLSAVGRSGDGSNEDDDVELWLVQMPDAKSLDLRALDGAQLHVQAGAGGGAGAQGDARRVEVCRFAPPGAAAVGRGAAGGKGFVWGGQPITELALVSDPLPRGGLVAVLPGCDGRPPIVRPITRSVTCVSAAAVPQPESTPTPPQESLSAKKKCKQKKLADKAEVPLRQQRPRSPQLNFRFFSSKPHKRTGSRASAAAAGGSGGADGGGGGDDCGVVSSSDSITSDIASSLQENGGGTAAEHSRQAGSPQPGGDLVALAFACGTTTDTRSWREQQQQLQQRHNQEVIPEATTGQPSPTNPLSPLSDGSCDSYFSSPPHALDRCVTEPGQHKSALSPTPDMQSSYTKAEGIDDAEEGEREQEEAGGKGLGAGVMRLQSKISKAVDKRMSARGGEAGFTFMRGLNGRRRDRKGGSGAASQDFGKGETEGGGVGAGAGGGAGGGGGGVGEKGAGGLRFLSPGMARNHSVPVAASESARPPKLDKVVYGPPVRVPVDPSRPIALSIRPRPRSGTLPQGTPHGSRTCLLVTLDSSIILVTDDGIRVWDIQHVMTAQGALGLGNPRGDEEAAAFFWVPFGAGVSAAKSIAADVKGRMVFTGHRDGRVLVWRVRERGAEREGAAAVGDGAAQGFGGGAMGGNDSGVGGGERLPGWKVWAELVAEWQAHTTTVTALVVTSYGELWSAGDRGVIKAWPWPSLCSELSRTSSSPSPAALPPTVPVSNAAPLRAPCVIRPAAVPVLLHAPNSQLPQNCVAVASASAAAADGDADDSRAARGAGGDTPVTVTESSGSVAAATTGSSGGGGSGSSAAAGTGGESEGGSGGVVYGVTSVRRLVSDPATGQVWSIGAASISIWDARKRALVCHVKVKDEERAAADTSSGAVASGASSATAATSATASSATAPANNATGAASATNGGGASIASSLSIGSAPIASSNGEAPVLAAAPPPPGDDEPLSSTSSASASSYSSSSSRPPKRKLHAVAPAGDGTVWIGHGSGMLRQYDWAGGKLQEVVMEAGVCCLCVVGLRLWVGTADGSITVLHVRTGRVIGAWQAHSPAPCSKAAAKAARAAAAAASPSPSIGTASDLSQPSDDTTLSSQASTAAAAAAATPAAIRQLARCSSFIVCVSRTGQVSAWLVAIPGPVDPALRATLSSSSALFTSRQRFRLAACTWNVGEERAVQRSVEAWLGEVAGEGPEREEGADRLDQAVGAGMGNGTGGAVDVGNGVGGGGADIIAVGLQEVEMNAGAIAIAAAKESVRLGLQERGSALGAHWVATIGAALASRGAFVRIVSRQMAGILITVWARASFAHLIRDVEVGAVPRGFGRTLGNKGAVAVRMSVCGRSVAVLSCHLAAHMEGVAKRNEDWRRIYRHLSFYRPQTTLASAASSAAKAAGGGLKGGFHTLMG
ncbi:unnamed protein product [Closterium sp. NIES-64]|nr:unnamed protein product [Closterium sp. NIES-64]